MNKLTIAVATSLLLFNAAVFADPHLDEAIKHAEAAVNSGKTGHSHDLVEHAGSAREHAMAAELTEKGQAKTRTDNAIIDLDEAIKHGKMMHAEIATTYAEAALDDLKKANK